MKIDDIELKGILREAIAQIEKKLEQVFEKMDIELSEQTKRYLMKDIINSNAMKKELANPVDNDEKIVRDYLDHWKEDYDKGFTEKEKQRFLDLYRKDPVMAFDADPYNFIDRY